MHTRMWQCHLIVLILILLPLAAQSQGEKDSSSKSKASNTDPIDEDQPPILEVLKVKGDRAIVRITGAKVEVGDKAALYAVPDESDSKGATAATDSEASMGDEAERNNFFGFDTSISLMTTTQYGSSERRETADVGLSYGWNKQTVEYGALFNYSFTRTDTYDSRSLEVGGLFDYNFSPNDQSGTIIYGVRGSVAVGEEDSSSQTKGALSFRVEPAVFVKWSNMIGSIGYRYRSAAYESTDVVDSGLIVRVGLQSYF